LLLIKLLLLLVDQGAQCLICAALVGGRCEHWAGRGKPKANGQGQEQTVTFHRGSPRVIAVMLAAMNLTAKHWKIISCGSRDSYST
ncbi:hypothetical protein, partial [Metallibacterium sp.]|uniref:hypothetical protein n=1 Tax=Metallibacterium sp. TaxID=2940281 RepID=UPI002632D1CF